MPAWLPTYGEELHAELSQETEALSMPACAVSETGIFDFARGYLADHDGRSDHVGRAFLTFWTS